MEDFAQYLSSVHRYSSINVILFTNRISAEWSYPSINFFKIEYPIRRVARTKGYKTNMLNHESLYDADSYLS